MCLKFKGFLAENNISQQEVADALGITRENVNQKINGKQEFTLSQVKILCEKYGLSADEYFV